MHKKNRHILVFFVFGLILAPVFFLGALYYTVSRDVSTRIQRGAIDRVISSESHIYYDDGATPIGVFFKKTHRKYVHYSDIPKSFAKALIAAEDRNFFTHRGFDLRAMLRALVANIKSGKVVQGGSTITQQTAKNIFRRERRSYWAKLKELMQAILLERKYTKQEILEMYTNQFFVNGYGKGLKIAAKYFFGKDAKDLDLVEGAFIAGSVKGPNRYNPFIKKTKTEKEEAIRLAKLRKDYVLSNMLKMNFISQKQYTEARNRQVPFKEGKITYRLNVILDYIREQLESDYFRDTLKEQGVENVATSGISIYTSINRDIQKAALGSLRKHLPLIDVKLNGYNIKQPLSISEELPGKDVKRRGDALPFLSRITAVNKNGEKCLVVSWEKGGGVIDYEGIRPMVDAWLKWKFGSWARFDKKYVPEFLRNFRVGDIVPVKFSAPQDGSSRMRLMLSMIPELNGGIVVLHEGMIKAMAGGFFNRFFNRAVDAKRQLGSIFKPIIYAAALQLKWNSLDPLMNLRDLFRFENTFYVPKPDHKPKAEKISMAWAGVKSENLATVWLLYHLTDRLNEDEFRQVTDLVGLSRKKEESYLSYKNRIRDKHGVVVNKRALMEAAFEKAKMGIVSDIIFGGHARILGTIKRLHLSVDRDKLSLRNSEEKKLLRFSFKRLRELNQKMDFALKRVNLLLEKVAHNKKSAYLRQKLLESLSCFYMSKEDEKGSRIVYAGNPKSLNGFRLTNPAIQWLLKRNGPLKGKEIWIDGIITPKILEMLEENMKKNYRELLGHKRYSPEVLSKIRDFRTLVNLLYVVRLSKKMGISTKLEPVLSYPLGPNSISIMEAALAYQTIMTGCIYPLSSEGRATEVPIITKIVDREGESVWEYRKKTQKILSDRVSLVLTEILKKVMEIGTGHSAKDAISLFGIPIPSFGKTGTSNLYTNSSFLGFIPGSCEETRQLDIRKGYVISTYVGYDDNRPMKGKNIVIYGSSGALPLWIDTANAIAKTRSYKKNLQLADLAFNPLKDPFSEMDGFQTVPVSPLTGLPIEVPAEISGTTSFQEMVVNAEKQGETLILKRDFEPRTNGG